MAEELQTVSKAEAILSRMITFAVSIDRLCRLLPKGKTAAHIAGQLIRCATAAGPNYAEARSAESLNDFIHKLGIVLKELNECLVWLRMIRELDFVSHVAIDPVTRECEELCRIAYASIRTASRRRRANSAPSG